MSEKWVETEFKGDYTIDGAGVRLRRIFGGPQTYLLTDPFLLLDHFGSDKPEEYLSGFPWHPHRGIETVTYQLEGKTEHEDSEGNKGVIFPGDVQWMTAGSGIFHQEMPKPINLKNPNEMLLNTGMPNSAVGIQLWVNIPRKIKMSNPVYRYILSKRIPAVENGKGAYIKIISGRFLADSGAIKSTGETDVTYLDIRMKEESDFSVDITEGNTSFLYVISGSGETSGSKKIVRGTAYLFSHSGSSVHVKTSDSTIRFILVSGKPLRESIAWYGPIVMNTNEELQVAFSELDKGNFIKNKKPIFEDVD
ncbi:MAG: Pirin domain protein [Candidatus Parvarchaeum acidophilus ARMAN-5]|jgi:redox-sensitive bicupin YhaK (pirin superfamily)|uniref:Pirin domain protein n=1 Tax=Candidatus Parvarchaeum acidophilus ARMAN-5 TaxID=662762 RepID=D6GVI4_PARA5|nr:MAG: Pirin domain protein [Candidatus Parvarchaeum acidophilus ARMAN-5]